MKIGILTSSRADYGIYRPLIKKLKLESRFDIHLLVFGTHLSKRHGYTLNEINLDGFKISQKVKTAPSRDSPSDISKSIASTINKFNKVWKKEHYDLIFALGDRFEMFAAVTSTLPFNLKVAHIHGGETTLGAIDNSFRHSITLMSKLHFTTCEEYKNRVIEITGNETGVYNVGALSIENLSKMQFLSKDEFYLKFDIDLGKPTILFTFHPETITYQKNEQFILTIIEVFKALKNYQIVITLPNADTQSRIIRQHIISYCSQNDNAVAFESLGSIEYLSCMYHCSFMLGNTSSGFVEAYWFPKPVINLGERQSGRIITPNIISSKIDKNEILEKIAQLENSKSSVIPGHYGDGNTSERIVEILKTLSEVND